MARAGHTPLATNTPPPTWAKKLTLFPRAIKLPTVQTAVQIFYSTHTPSALQDPRFSAWREYLRRVGEGFAAGFELVRELKDCAQCILHVELASILLKINDILHGIKLSTPNSQIKRNRCFLNKFCSCQSVYGRKW